MGSAKVWYASPLVGVRDNLTSPPTMARQLILLGILNVLSGTIMQKTKIPLQKWFLAIALAVNAKKSFSSHQLARDLELNQKTVWYLMQRVRAAMAADQGPLLRGIIEADETFLGGKPRKRNRRSSRKPAKRGRGTSKTAVLGVVERGGKVKAMVTDELTGRGIQGQTLRVQLSRVQ